MYGDGPGNCFEGMTTLAALAAATAIRLGLLVTGVTYRHPSLFAAQAVTIDHASHGRLDLSLGAAWFEAEHRALGFEFPSAGARFDLLEDTLEIVTRLMTGERCRTAGTRVLHDAQLRPGPVQQPHPPIWIGANGPKRGLPTAAKWADVWHSFAPPEYVEAMSRRIDELAEARTGSVGIVHRVVTVAVGAVRRGAADDRACTGTSASAPRLRVAGRGRGRVAEFAEQVMPDFAG